MSEEPSKSSAFAKGGLGCLGLFVLAAFVSLILGGNAHADLGGLIMLFVIGGVVGLIVLWVYNRGRRDGGGK